MNTQAIEAKTDSETRKLVSAFVREAINDLIREFRDLGNPGGVATPDGRLIDQLALDMTLDHFDVQVITVRAAPIALREVPFGFAVTAIKMPPMQGGVYWSLGVEIANQRAGGEVYKMSTRLTYGFWSQFSRVCSVVIPEPEFRTEPDTQSVLELLNSINAANDATRRAIGQ